MFYGNVIRENIHIKNIKKLPNIEYSLGRIIQKQVIAYRKYYKMFNSGSIFFLEWEKMPRIKIICKTQTLKIKE